MNNFILKPKTNSFINKRSPNAKRGHNKKLRVVTLNYLPSAYQFLTDWIHENGHQHVLAVTTPGIKAKRTPSYKDVLKLVPEKVTTLVTSRTRSVLMPILPQFKPDLILSYTFPHRLPVEISQLATYGCINVHPSILPLYRGPNPLRQFYDGAKFFGSTVHRIDEGYDSGEILSQEFEEMPEIISLQTAVRWGELIKKSITKGIERAISGKPGVVQDHSKALYADPYTEEEKWIDFNESSKVVLRKTLGLNLCGGLAKAHLNGEVYKIHSADYLTLHSFKPAGSVIKQERSVYDVATLDGAVRLVAEPFNPSKKYAHVLPSSAFLGQSTYSGQMDYVIN